jgi:C1A family cysteine protease
MKQSIIEGFPFVFGINIYETFESENVKNTGNVPMPDTSNEKLLGGHAVMAVMFDDDKKVFGCRNSWGTNWGDKGYFYLPYDYILNSDLASDFWIITSLNLDEKEDKYYEEEYNDNDNDDYFDNDK